ncbi:MAG: decarboxylase [Candidatus Woesearchaeota archaeon]
MARFILSKSRLLEQYNTIGQLADAVSYSYKTNPEVGQVLETETGCYFSVHSMKLLSTIKDKSRVWFFAQGWDRCEIEELLNLGVTHFVVDNIADLDTLVHSATKDISLLLRMKLKEHTIHTGKHFVFGMGSEDVNNKVKELKANPKIKEIGIHFHRKTQNISEWSLKEELEQSLSEETLAIISTVNIGGGFPASYKNSRADEVIRAIFSKVKELGEWLSSKNIKMILEPGRFLAAPAIKLEAEIKSVSGNNIIVDCSVYNAAMDTFVAHVRLLVEGEQENGKAYTIKGITPDSMDILRYRVFLKSEPKKGDKIIFLNAGAYNFSTEFCGLDKIPTEVED